MKYNISDFVYSAQLCKVSGDKVKSARLSYTQHRKEVKKILIKTYYRSGYFKDISFSEENTQLLENGYSPIYKTLDGEEHFLLNVHHIIPLSFGGKPTTPSNLIPIPIKFHEFVHAKIIDPQTNGLPTGVGRMVYGLPDFSKITFKMMMDSNFIKDYQTYMNNIYQINNMINKKHHSR